LGGLALRVSGPASFLMSRSIEVGRAGAARGITRCAKPWCRLRRASLARARVANWSADRSVPSILESSHAPRARVAALPARSTPLLGQAQGLAGVPPHPPTQAGLRAGSFAGPSLGPGRPRAHPSLRARAWARSNRPPNKPLQLTPDSLAVSGLVVSGVNQGRLTGLRRRCRGQLSGDPLGSGKKASNAS